jgi:hypothetical protein
MSRDFFGADAPVSDGSPAVTPPIPASIAIPAAAAAAGTPTPAPGTPAPTLAQAVDKAVAKATADQAVAANPDAVHHVKLVGMPKTVAGAALTGAGVGAAVGGPPGAAVGALVGFVMEKYQIGGGPITVIIARLKRVGKAGVSGVAGVGQAALGPVPASTVPAPTVGS